MKFAIALFFVSFSVFAGDNLSCVNVRNKDVTYTVIQKGAGDKYELTVSLNELVPQSCRSRWGCDYETTILWKENLVLTDWQGVAEYSGRFTTIVNGDRSDELVELTHRGGKIDNAILECVLINR